ncbi:hypothetical protein Nepgr_008078 [Nepenthes gracilis]|uniref:Uncharacterized protein n=1 Tax=Nepenthes gracilis TaxID=150966 RepID=A0AAD3XIX0_NEPGR|nr:hypothetical protein Nepgr_008078 [Nepenthes gracilis]
MGSFGIVPGREHEYTRFPADSATIATDLGLDPGNSSGIAALLQTETPATDSVGEQPNFRESKKKASGPGVGDRGTFYNGGKGWVAGVVEESKGRARWEETGKGGGLGFRKGSTPPSQNKPCRRRQRNTRFQGENKNKTR